jgi:hypothetical protein
MVAAAHLDDVGEACLVLLHQVDQRRAVHPASTLSSRTAQRCKKQQQQQQQQQQHNTESGNVSNKLHELISSQR